MARKDPLEVSYWSLHRREWDKDRRIGSSTQNKDRIGLRADSGYFGFLTS